jgi:hypothetical protein
MVSPFAESESKDKRKKQQVLEESIVVWRGYESENVFSRSELEIMSEGNILVLLTVVLLNREREKTKKFARRPCIVYDF